MVDTFSHASNSFRVLVGLPQETMLGTAWCERGENVPTLQIESALTALEAGLLSWTLLPPCERRPILDRETKGIASLCGYELDE
jgi:hypothetical protein